MGEAERHTGLTLWRQTAAAIPADIARRDPPPGGQLPTEAAYAARFGVNRHTVRRALEALRQDGLVRTEQGRGCFAAEAVLEYAVGPRTRFSEVVRRQHREPAGRHLDVRTLPAEPRVAAALGLARGAAIVRLARLGTADGRPVSLSQHNFPAERIPGLAQALLRPEMTVSAALAYCGVADYRRRTTRVTARMPTPREIGLLDMPGGRPVLVTESVNVDAAGTTVEFGVTCYPTPRVHIVFET